MLATDFALRPAKRIRNTGQMDASTHLGCSPAGADVSSTLIKHLWMRVRRS